MRKLFYTGLGGLLLFEILNVYFIMPMPGSQQMHSIDVAYFLYTWRWVVRIVFLAVFLYGVFRASWKRTWLPAVSVLIVGVAVYFLNFRMAADHMFHQPERLILANAASNKVDTGRLVIGVTMNGSAKAYPIQFMGYHHQVQDTMGRTPLLITYCTVCRTGRVFEPLVRGKHQRFRLVGMDHFNAMLEDVATKSWWRQATGEAIAGELKGERLPEVLSTQTSLGQWLKLYPQSLVMQADPSFVDAYDSTFDYENGKSKSSLTGTDSLSWKKKSWVVGVSAGNHAKAYDWNLLKAKRIINDTIDTIPVAVALASDNKSFFAFERPAADAPLAVHNDTLLLRGLTYRIDGKGINTQAALKKLPASQEFWHSWLAFNPGTLR